MPELPEVETTMRALAARLTGRRLSVSGVSADARSGEAPAWGLRPGSAAGPGLSRSASDPAFVTAMSTATHVATGAAASVGAKAYLSVNNIEVIYDHVILVLKGVSLNVPEGKIVTLLGANGAGKTTTLKAVSNLLRAERGDVTKGTIEFMGTRVDRLTPNELVKMGVCQVMEGRHCFQHLTVDENLLTGAFTRRVGHCRTQARPRSGVHLLPRGSSCGGPACRDTPRAVSSR